MYQVVKVKSIAKGIFVMDGTPKEFPDFYTAKTYVKQLHDSFTYAIFGKHMNECTYIISNNE